MNCAICPHRQSGAQHARRLFASHGDDDDLPSVFFFQTKSLFDGVVVGLACDESEIVVLNPVFGFIDDESRRRIRYGLDATDDLHSVLHIRTFYKVLYACTIHGAKPALRHRAADASLHASYVVSTATAFRSCMTWIAWCTRRAPIPVRRNCSSTYTASMIPILRGSRTGGEDSHSSMRPIRKPAYVPSFSATKPMVEGS